MFLTSMSQLTHSQGAQKSEPAPGACDKDAFIFIYGSDFIKFTMNAAIPLESRAAVLV